MEPATPNVEQLDEVLTEFTLCLRRGERPSTADYVRRYPQWADNLHELLPTIAGMEALKRRHALPGTTPTGLPGAAAAAPGETQAFVGGAAAEPADVAAQFRPAQQADELGRLGPYRVLRPLGRGGMGAVFLAEDTRLNRTVALKVLLPALARRPEARERFLREARSAAAIEHEHIVTIYQVDEDHGVPYIAMALLRGGTLEQYLARGVPPSVPEIVAIGRQIARGLAAAHERRLIHRDIKPANVWLEEEHGGPARVKLLDFGLARPEAAVGAITQAGDVVGTPSYMAPEQARGEAVDGRADLFSLGVVLYRLCTGRLPFDGATTMHVLMALASHAPPPPHALSPAIPRPLSLLVMQLLAKDARQRPASARAVADRLEAIERALPHPRLRGRALALALLVVAATGIALAVAAAWRFRTPAPTPVANADPPAPAVVPPAVVVPPVVPAPARPLSATAILLSADWAWTPAEKLGPDVNSDARDAAPTLSGDGLCLVFYSDRGDRGALWESRRTSTAVPFGKPAVVQALIDDGPLRLWDPCLRADGLALYVIGQRLDPPGPAELLVLRRAAVDQPWGKPAPVPAEENFPPQPFGMRLSADGCTLVYNNGQMGGEGGTDIWTCRRPAADQPFGAPVNLGPDVNTPDDDHVLALSGDGRTLLVARQRTPPEFVVTTRPGPDEVFGPPAPVALPGVHDCIVHPGGLSADGRILVFSARTKGREDADLYLTRRVPKK